MIRKAFRMSVYDGQHERYEHRHNPIWRELEDALLEHAVLTYSIFLPITAAPAERMRPPVAVSPCAA